MGTLEKLQAAGLAEDDAVVTAAAEEDAELVIETHNDDDAVVAEAELDEVGDELVSGDQDHSRVEVPKKTLSKLRRTRREAREQVTEKDAEIAALNARLDRSEERQRASLKKPSYAEYPDDASFETALLEYHSVMGEAPATPAPGARRPAPAAAPTRQPDFSDEINSHIDRAEKLGINLDKFAQADSAVRTTLGDSITDALIASVGDGSEKAIYLMGSKPAELAKVQQMLAADPSGLRVVGHLTRLATLAKVNKKPVSGAPRPSRSPSGDQGQVSAEARGYNKQLDAAEKAGDTQKMVQLRRKARKAGVAL